MTIEWHGKNEQTMRSKKYRRELVFLKKIRSFSDGVTFFLFDISVDKFEADHNPHFKINLILLNYMIFEFNSFSLSHIKNVINLDYIKKVDDGPGWSPDGGYFIAKDNVIYWRDGDISNLNNGGVIRILPGNFR